MGAVMTLMKEHWGKVLAALGSVLMFAAGLVYAAGAAKAEYQHLQQRVEEIEASKPAEMRQLVDLMRGDLADIKRMSRDTSDKVSDIRVEQARQAKDIAYLTGKVK